MNNQADFEENPMDNPNTFWVKAYTPDGWQASFTMPTDSDGYAAGMAARQFVAGLAKAGLTPVLPGLTPEQEKEVIVTVMRRVKESDGADIIDFYTDWLGSPDKPFGIHRYAHTYLDTPEQTDEFLAFSGFKSLNEIPVYNSASALKRTPGKVHQFEVKAKTPFYVVRQPGKNTNGSTMTPWDFVRYETLDGGLIRPESKSSGSEPAQPKASTNPPPPQQNSGGKQGDSTNFVAHVGTLKHTQNGTAYIVLENDMGAKASLLSTSDIPEAEFWTEGKQVLLVPPIHVVAVKKKSGNVTYFEATKIEPISEVTF